MNADNLVKRNAVFLEHLDELATHGRIDSLDKIHWNGSISNHHSNSIKPLIRELFKLKREHENKNKDFAKKLKKDPIVKDAKVVMGCVVTTFNFSDGIPSAIKDFSDDAVEGDVAGRCFTGREYDFLGLSIVDSKLPLIPRNTTLWHELRHFGWAMLDRITLLHPKSYDEFTGNEIVTQHEYLNELHSSLMDFNYEWINAGKDVYTTKSRGRRSINNEGKHWELVGSNEIAIESTMRLLGYIQGFYTLAEVSGNKGEYYRAVAIAGASHNVTQAQRIVGKHWTERVVKPGIASSSYALSNRLYLRESVGEILKGTTEMLNIPAPGTRSLKTA